MFTIKYQHTVLVCLVFCMLQIRVGAQKQIAITIDDPTTKATPKLNWQERDSFILKALDHHNITAALFICGMRVDNSEGRVLMNNWDSKDHLMCNHSYSHLYYNSTTATASVFISDFKKTDPIIRVYRNYTQLFRFPYLKEGSSAEKRNSMRAALKHEGYNNGYVTIDASDWYIDAQLTKTLNQDFHADLTAFKEYYVEHILDRANYYDSLAQVVFQRNIKHTLLLHHSLLNALFLEDLLAALKANDWKLIDAKRAFEDDVFKEQPDIEPCGESIVWQCARQIDSIAKTLRYPAEDAAYEKLPLENYLKKYTERAKQKQALSTYR